MRWSPERVVASKRGRRWTTSAGRTATASIWTSSWRSP